MLRILLSLRITVLAMSSLMIIFGLLNFSHIIPSKGNIDSHEMHSVMGCDYLYDTQPAQTALSCNVLTAIVLRCQVSNNRSDFSIRWHYSNSEPDSSNIPATKYVRNSTNTIITTVWNYSHNTTSLISELIINEFSEKDNGYYWCSVNSSNGTNSTTPNPSVVLHILHQIDCAAQAASSECGEEVHFYSMSLAPNRCADQDISIEIVEAQNCTTEEGSNVATTTPALLTTASELQSSHPQNTDGNSGMLNFTTTQLPTMITFAMKSPSLSLTLGIIIGASMGGLILVLLITTGLLFMCVVRMKVYIKHQGEEHRADPTLPQSDDIQRYSSIPMTDINKMDDTNRISKMAVELNVSYECISQANDHIYDCIQ